MSCSRVPGGGTVIGSGEEGQCGGGALMASMSQITSNIYVLVCVCMCACACVHACVCVCVCVCVV